MCFLSLCLALRKGNGNRLSFQFILIAPAGYFWQGLFFLKNLTLAINYIAALTGQRRRFQEGCGGILTRWRAGRGWFCPSAFKICAAGFPPSPLMTGYEACLILHGKKRGFFSKVALNDSTLHI